MDTTVTMSTANPEATTNSMKLTPPQLFFSVNVILQTMLRDVGGHFALAPAFARIPTDADAHFTQLVLVRLGKAADRVYGNGSREDNYLFVCGVGIKACGKCSRKKVRRIELAPGVKPDGIHLFFQDLRGAEIFSGCLHNTKTLRKPREHCGGHDAENSHAHDDFRQRKRALPLQSLASCNHGLESSSECWSQSIFNALE